MKYPEFRKMFERAKWYGGHLCKQGDLFFKLVKTNNGKHLAFFTYSQLSENDLSNIESIERQEQERDERVREYNRTVLVPRVRLEQYVMDHGTLIDRSMQSESEYWTCKGVDGTCYYVRISSHKHPTGSMTDMNLRKLDLMSDNCASYLKLFGLD